jgi:cytochrome P450
MADIFVELGLDGVLSAEGEAWRRQRRLTVEALSHRHLRGFFPTLVSVAERLRRRLAAAAADGRAIDVQDAFNRFTVDVTTRLAFGYDMNTLEHDGDAIQHKLELLFPKAAERIMAMVPYWRVVRLPSDRRVDRAIAELRTFVLGLVEAARARAAGGGEPPTNFLEAMVAARDEHGAPYDDDTLIGNCLTLMLAGEETTATTLSWAVHYLCDAPATVAALQRELDAAGIDGVPDQLEQTARMPTAHAVLLEATRLRTIAPLMFLEPLADDVVGGVAIPKGVNVGMLLRAPTQRAAHFADPERFRAERWLGEPAGAHEPHTHLPFGSGPRICPGRNVALTEMKVALGTVLSCFDLERADDGGAVREVFGFTMRSEGIRVRLRPRARR